MIKMLFCDLDGTLLPQGAAAVSVNVKEKIRALIRKGVRFCVASGRPYEQMKALFGELSNDIIFICLDGALVMHRNCVLYKKRFCKLEAARLLSSATGEVYGRGVSATVTERDGAEAIKIKINRLGSEVFKVAVNDSPRETIGRVCYNKGGITEYVAADCDKGAAAKVVMQKFCVTAEETAALGDGENDLPLLKVVGSPAKMEKCAPVLAPLSIPSVSTAIEWLEKF